MKTKNITINIPDGYDDVKFNEKTNEIEFIKRDGKPRSWEEYYKQKQGTCCFRVVSFTDCVEGGNRAEWPQFNEFNTMEEAKAFIALGKLIQLRDAWWGDWKPDWEDAQVRKFTIICNRGVLFKDSCCSFQRTLVFPTSEMRDDFLKTFRDLIEEAKPLL